MYGPHVAILLMCVSRNTRRVDFRGLTGSQWTPRVWGVTYFEVGRANQGVTCGTRVHATWHQDLGTLGT